MAAALIDHESIEYVKCLFCVALSLCMGGENKLNTGILFVVSDPPGHHALRSIGTHVARLTRVRCPAPSPSEPEPVPPQGERAPEKRGGRGKRQGIQARGYGDTKLQKKCLICLQALTSWLPAQYMHPQGLAQCLICVHAWPNSCVP